MTVRILLIKLFILCVSQFYAQNDTVRFHGIVNARAMIQTGNLHQIGGGFLADFSVGNQVFSSEVLLSYDHVTVNGFTVINDSWNHLRYKFKPNNRIYPLVQVNAGFAKSFGIKTSIVVGVGGGINIIRKSPTKFLSFNLIGGYMNFTYENITKINGDAINAHLVVNTEMFKGEMLFHWEVQSYVMPSNSTIFGIMNSLRMSFPLTKSMSITATHQTIYNEQVDLSKTRLNTIFMFGLQFSKL